VIVHGGARHAIIGEPTTLTVTNHRCDGPIGPDTPDPAIERIRYEQKAPQVDRQISRAVKRRILRWPAIARKPTVPVAGKSADRSIRGNFPDSVAEPLRDIEIAQGIDGNTHRIVQRCFRCWAAVARASGDSVSRHGGDNAGRRDFTNPLIARIGDIDVAEFVDGHLRREV
jgi:hypothetical protein